MAERILNFFCYYNFFFFLGGGGGGREWVYKRTPTCKGSGDVCKIILSILSKIISPPPPGSAVPSYFQPFTIETVD